MNKILIITGGEVDITSSQKYTESIKYSIIIAVDGGLKTAKILNLLPDIILGDFDSVSLELLEEYKEKGCEIIKLNPMKDDTDTEVAYVKALEYDAKEIHILGGLGSRFDHSLANVFLLKRAYEAGIKAYIISEYCRISIISGHTEVERENLYGKYISLIQFDGNAIGVTLKGFVYGLDKFDFDTAKTYRLGISNELANEKATIDIEEGYMLMIEAKEDK